MGYYQTKKEPHLYRKYIDISLHIWHYWASCKAVICSLFPAGFELIYWEGLLPVGERLEIKRREK